MASAPTAHIEAQPGDIKKTVIMPGDPLRAEFIAKTYLDDYRCVNNVRNMLAFSGTYKGKEVTVMGSGMGMPSIGIYSYELYTVYGVERIIRVGSCGAYSPDLNLYDIILVDEAYSKSTYAKEAFLVEEEILKPSPVVNADLTAVANELGYPLTAARIHSSDVFYAHRDNLVDTMSKEYGCKAVEMESFALFANAQELGKEAACLLTVSDSLVKNEATTAQERQNSFTKMMEIALGAIK